MEPGLFFYLLTAIAVINCLYFIYFSKAAFCQVASPTLGTQPTSIIVCAKNEQEQIKRLVPKLLQQQHPDFEIILVNDASNDNTLEIMEEYAASHAHVHLVNVVNNENFWANKKYALTLGIKKASNDLLVFIDADCRPSSTQWLAAMAGPVNENVEIVIGYSGYKNIKKSLLNAIIRFETVWSALQYIGSSLRNNPYMGVGRNLAYTSHIFYSNAGFMSHMNVMGGDDDLFVNEAATSTNTAVNLHPETFTTSEPKTSWKSWWHQKRRHTAVAKHYKRKHKWMLGGFYLTELLFISTAVITASFGEFWPGIVGLIVVRYILVMVIVGRGLSRFRESGLIPYIPLLEILLIIAQLGLFFHNSSSRPTQWK
jgi:glycosyltransferase involved in cell wall biosynthesis